MTSQGTRPLRLLALAGAAATAAAVVLAACSSGGGSGSSPTGAASGVANSGRGPVQTSPSATPRAGGFGPAASGVIAALSGRTMQVQNATDGQVAVSYTAKTTFTRTVTLARSKLVAGSCVDAIGAATTGSGATTGSSGAAAATSFTAATITVSAAAKDGSCAAGGFTGGRGGFTEGARGGFTGGARPSGFPTAFPGGRNRPSGFPTGAFGSGAPGGRASFGGISGFASGKVTSVTATGIVVTQAARGSQGARTVTVTIGASTRITEQATATATALKVGKCVSATGSTGSSGAVTATRIAISTAGKNGCTTGTGFGGFGRGAAGQQPGGSANGS